MEDVCCFEMESKCTILKDPKICEGCKFRKTASQFRADNDRAVRILQQKGLEAIFDGTTVSTRKVGGRRENG